jgi:hypothetical protein
VSVIPDRAKVVDALQRNKEEAKLLKRQLKLIDDYNEEFGDKAAPAVDDEAELAKLGA